MSSSKLGKSIAAIFLSAVFINLASPLIELEAKEIKQPQAFQLVDANGVLVGVVSHCLDKAPRNRGDRVIVFAGGNQLEWNLHENSNDVILFYKGIDCVEPWFILNEPLDNYRWVDSSWVKNGDKFNIPTAMSTSSGVVSTYHRGADSNGVWSDKCLGPTTSGGRNIDTTDNAWNVKKLDVPVTPNRANLAWPLRVVPDNEVNGPLFFNFSFASTSYSPGGKSFGVFWFSASEPYLVLDIIARDPKGKVVKTWKNQYTGTIGVGAVVLDKTSPTSITKYKFSLIYKGKVVATLP